MAHFPANVFHEITGITDALKKNAHDQNEQTIHICSINNATVSHQFGFTLLYFVQMFYCFLKHTAVKILCLNCSSINIYDITQADFNIKLEKNILYNVNRIFMLLSIKICHIYEFYHNLNNGIWFEKRHIRSWVNNRVIRVLKNSYHMENPY